MSTDTATRCPERNSAGVQCELYDGHPSYHAARLNGRWVYEWYSITRRAKRVSS